MEITDIWQSIQDSLIELVQTIIDFTPRIIGALIVMIIGSIVAGIIAKVIGKGLRFVESQSAVKEVLAKANMKMSVSGIIAKIIRLIILVIFAGAASEVLGIQVITDLIASLVEFTPQILYAVIVAGITFIAANILRDLVKSSLSATKSVNENILGTAVYVVVLVFGLTTAVSEIGVDTDLVTTNISIIVAGIVAAAALALGLGGRKVAGSWLAGMVAKNTVQKGQKLNIDGETGTVKSVTGIVTVVETSKGDIIVSNGRLIK